MRSEAEELTQAVIEVVPDTCLKCSFQNMQEDNPGFVRQYFMNTIFQVELFYD